MSSDIRPTSVQPPSNLPQRLDGRFSEGKVPPSNPVQPPSRAGACVGAGGGVRTPARPPAHTPARTREKGLDEVGRLDGATQVKRKEGTLRTAMPQTADLADWLRAEFGKEKADALMLKGKQGKGGFYAAEVGPDGVLREFGSTASGARAVLGEDGTLQWQQPERARHANARLL